MRIESEIIVNITNCFHISLTSLSISLVRYLANFISVILQIVSYIAWFDEYWNSQIINRKHSANIVVCKPQCLSLNGPNDVIELIMVTNNSVNALSSQLSHQRSVIPIGRFNTIYLNTLPKSRNISIHSRKINRPIFKNHRIKGQFYASTKLLISIQHSAPLIHVTFMSVSSDCWQSLSMRIFIKRSTK